MASDDLFIRIVNATGEPRRFIACQANAAAAANTTNLYYVWQSVVLDGGGGLYDFVLPIAFGVAGMSGEPPSYTLSAAEPGVYGQCWSLQQASLDAALTLAACTGTAPDSVEVVNQVSFARLAGVVTKASGLLFGASLVPADRARLQVAPSFWIALSSLRRGDPVAGFPPAPQSCEVTYEVPSNVTQYIVTAAEKASGEIAWTIFRSTEPRLR